MMTHHKLYMVFKLVTIAWRNVIRNWRHSLATIIAIALGFMSVSLFDGFIRELTYRTVDGYAVRGMLGDVLIQKDGAQAYYDADPWKYSMDSQDQSFLEESLTGEAGVANHVRFLNVSGLATVGMNNAVFWGFGYDVEAGARMRGDRWAWDTTAGNPLYLAEPQSAILASGLGEMLGCKAANDNESFILPDGNYKAEDRPYQCDNSRILLTSTTESAQVNAIQVNVSGLYDAGFREVNRRHLHLSLLDAQRLLDSDKISMVSVQLDGSVTSREFIAQLQAKASKQGLRFEMTPWIEHRIASFVDGAFDILYVFRNLFMAIVVTIVVMSVANTVMKTVNERVREIGTLRSIGYLRRQLVFMFVCEGFFTSVIGSAIGLGMTVLASLFISKLDITYKAGVLSLPLHLKVAPAPSAWLASFVVLSLLATLTAWFCSRRACQMRVADALRHI